MLNFKVIFFLILALPNFLYAKDIILKIEETPLFIENTPPINEAWANWKYIYPKEDDSFLTNVSSTMIMGKREGSNLVYNKKDVYKNSIDLKKALLFFKQIQYITGVKYKNGKVYFIGKQKQDDDNTPIILPEDVLVSMRAVYNSNTNGAWVSIDPPDKEEDRAKFGVVKFGGNIENTHFGQVLFESDRILKSLSCGYDNVDKKKIESSDEWLKNEFDYIEFNKKYNPIEWHRFWFVSNEIEIFVDNESKTLKFGRTMMKVKTERVELVNGKLRTYFSQTRNDSASKFTANFNKNFKSYSEKYPVFKELENLAKLTAVFYWLNTQGLVLKFDENFKLPIRETPEKTPVIKAYKNCTTYKQTKSGVVARYEGVSITGGVDMHNFVFKEIKITKVNVDKHRKASPQSRKSAGKSISSQDKTIAKVHRKKPVIIPEDDTMFQFQIVD